MSALLEVRDLAVHFRKMSLGDLMAGKVRRIRAVNGVSLALARGETLGLVGESGCGKSTLGRAILRLLEPSSGEVRFDGAEVTAMSTRQLFDFRRRAQMIFQDPYASLNPQLTVGETLAEALRVHRICPRSEVRRRVAELMETVGLGEELVRRRPRSLSGGQLQRVGIARALALAPELVIADEAVAALDVSIQAQVLNLLSELQREYALAMIFIAHDLGVVRHLCRRVAVMYLGRIVETGPTEEVFNEPRHPYTKALVQAIPRMDPEVALPPRGLTGEPPSPARIPPGCPFHPRCPRAFEPCPEGNVPAERDAGGVTVACHLYPEAGCNGRA